MAKANAVTIGNTNSDLLSLQQCVDLICATGADNSVLVEGEMGIGKSAMLPLIAARFPDHVPVYFDLTTKDLGDLFLPYTIDIGGGRKMSGVAPSEDWGFQHNKPLILMLDELGKPAGGKAVTNTMLRLMHEHKLTDQWPLPEGSIVFGTTNLAVEGLGDTLQKHVYNRIDVVRMGKPGHEAWLSWAVQNSIAPEVCAMVAQFPTMLVDHDSEFAKDNPYINIPGKPTRHCVTPRSLHKASNIVRQRGKMDMQTMEVALAGCLGKAAAADMRAMLATRDKLPTPAEIKADPEKAKLPGDKLAAVVWVFFAIMGLSDETAAPYVIYASRLPAEQRGLFANMVSKSSFVGKLYADKKTNKLMGTLFADVASMMTAK